MRIRSFKKCSKPGCLSLAKYIPVISIPLVVGTVGPTDAYPRMKTPGIISFDPVCGNHKSARTRDYITEECFNSFSAKCSERGLTPIWKEISITFYGLEHKAHFDGVSLNLPVVEGAV
jgi:hypothetical protein